MPNTEEDLIGAVMVIQEMIERERRQDHIVLVNIPEQVAGNKKQYRRFDVFGRSTGGEVLTAFVDDLRV